MGVNYGDESNDVLFFEGEDGDSLHFVRKVEPKKEKNAKPSAEDILGAGFTEDVWFKKGVGLNRLVQKVGGKTTMTWELTSFSPGIGS